MIHNSGYKNTHSSPFSPPPRLGQCNAWILAENMVVHFDTTFPSFPGSLVVVGVWVNSGQEAMNRSDVLLFPQQPPSKKNWMWFSLASFSFPNGCRWISQRSMPCVKYCERQKCTSIMKNHYDFGSSCYSSLGNILTYRWYDVSPSILTFPCEEL